MSSRKSGPLVSPSFLSVLIVALAALAIGVTARRSHLTPSRLATFDEAALKRSMMTHPMPVYFEKNRGQVNSQARYLSRSGRYSVFLTDDAAVFSLIGGNLNRSRVPTGFEKHDAQPTKLTESDFRIRLLNTNRGADIRGLTPLPGRVNYLIGSDETRWHRDVPTFGRVQYRELYPGIDLIYHGSASGLEFDFVAAPDADTSKIQFAIEGPTTPTLNREGDLMIRTSAGTVTMVRPRVFQENADGTRTAVAASFAMAKDGTIEAGIPRRDVSIQLAAYDHSRKLVIDPQIFYSTYYGGSGDSTGPVNLEQFQGVTQGEALTVADVGLDVAVDANHDAYVTGTAYSSDLPTQNAFQSTNNGANSAPDQNPNVFIAKFDPTQFGASSLVYATYLGAAGDTAAGDIGQGNGDLGFGIAVDGSGEAFVVGQTYSGGTTFPGSSSCGTFGQSSNQGSSSTNVGFVSELDAAGDNVVYSCYIDGSSNATAARVALIPGCSTNCQAYITGSTQSTAAQGFPVTAATAFQTDLATQSNGSRSNAFFMVVGANGATDDYCTYYGGSGNGSNADAGLGIAALAGGQAYITGATYSSDLPTLNPLQSSYAGGGNATSNGFVAEFDPALSGAASMLYGTYLGGSGQTATALITISIGDLATGIALGGGKVWITGTTGSTDFPINGTSAPAFQSSNIAASPGNAGAPATAGFVSELDPTQTGAAQLLYSTYFGGDGFQLSLAPFGTLGFGDASVDIALNGGKVFITGVTTSTAGFPLSANACQTTNNSAGIVFFTSSVPITAFVAELDPTQQTPANQLVFSSYLGGSGAVDGATGIAVDTSTGASTSGDAYVGGLTYSTDFPVTNSGFRTTNQAAGNSSTNAFLTVLDPTSSDCNRIFATPSASASPTPTATATATGGATATATSTATASTTATPTASPTSSSTATATATATSTTIATSTATATSVPTPTATLTAVATTTATATVAPTATATATVAPTATATATPAPTPTIGPVIYRPAKILYLRRKPDTTSAAHLIRLVNPRRNGTVIIGTVTLNGTDFGLDSAATTCTPGLTVTPGEHCDIRVFYSPTMLRETSTGSVTVTDNSSNSPHTTTLQGGVVR